MLNPAELEALSRQLFPQEYTTVAPPQITEPEGISMLTRLGEHALNLPANVINELTQNFIGVGQMFAPEADRMKQKELQALKLVPQFFDVAPGTTTGEKVADFAGAELAPSLAAAIIPYAGASKALRVAGTLAEGGLPFLNAAQGISPIAREIIAQGVAGGFSGAQYGPDQALVGAAIGGIGGYTEKLTRAARLLPSLGIGTGEYAYQRTFGGMNAHDALLTASVDALGNLIPGKAAKGGSPYTPEAHMGEDLFDLSHSEGARTPATYTTRGATEGKPAAREGEAIVPIGRIGEPPPLPDRNPFETRQLDMPEITRPGHLLHEQTFVAQQKVNTPQGSLFEIPEPIPGSTLPPLVEPVAGRDNWGVTSIFNPLQLEHGGAQHEFTTARAESMFPGSTVSQHPQPRVTPPAIDGKQLELNSARLKQVLTEGRMPDWDAEKATLFDLDKYPISRNFELVEPAPGTLVGDARGGVPHFKNQGDPRQMAVEDLILKKDEAPQQYEDNIASIKGWLAKGQPVTNERVRSVLGIDEKQAQLLMDKAGVPFVEPQKPPSLAKPQIAPVVESPKFSAKHVEVVRAPGHLVTGEYTVKIGDKTVTVLKGDEGKGDWILKPTEPGYDNFLGGVLTKDKGMPGLKAALAKAHEGGLLDAKAKKPSPHDFDPAIHIEGEPKPIRGFPDEEHGHIFQRYVAEKAAKDPTYMNSEEYGVALANSSDETAQTNFFLRKGDDTTRIHREKLRQLIGVSDSQGLNKLKKANPQPIAKSFLPEVPPALQGKKGETETKSFVKSDWAKMEIASLPNATRGMVKMDSDGGLWLWSKGGKRIEATRIQEIVGPTKMKMKGGKLSLKSSITAQIAQETIGALAGGTAGGLVGYAKEGSVDSAIGYAMLGAGLGVVGVRALKRLQAHQGPHIKSPVVKMPLDATVKERVKQFAIDTIRTQGGIAVAGRGGFQPHMVRVAESWLGLNMPWLVKESKLRSEGLISDVVSQLQNVIDANKKIKPSASFVTKASLYLKGQLAPPAEVFASLRKNGALTQEEWERLPATARSHLTERWITKDNATNTNTRGGQLSIGPGNNEIQIWRTTTGGKKELADLQRKHLEAAAATADDKVFMELPIKAREAINTIQGILLDAIPTTGEGRLLRNKLLGTMDQYQTRTFAMFTDPSHQPTEPQVLARMREVADIRDKNFLESHDVSDAAKPGFQEVKPGVWLSNTDAALFKLDHDDHSLRRLVEEEIKDYKQNKASFSKALGESSDIDASLLGARKELTPALRELLGEHKNVTDEIVHTLNRITGSAQAARMITLMGDSKHHVTGLRLAYDNANYQATKNGLNQIVSTSTDARAIQGAQNKLAELHSYIPTKEDPRLGLFGDKWVSRFAHDQLKDYKSPWGIFESSMGRTISKANNYMKQVHAPFSLFTQVRNLVSVPAFMAMGRATDAGAIKTAWDLLTNKNHPLWSRMRQLGVENATQAHGEFKYGMNELINGAADGKIISGWNKFHKMVLDTYSKPDMFVRISTFLSAEKRFAKEFPGKSAAEVESMALKFTSERTMDYNNLPSAIKTVRQVPFVNMYISYAYESLRIMKNMAWDAATKGDFQAGATLAGIATIPFIAQAAAESGLTPEQRKKWNIAKKFGPDYSRTRFKIPTGRTDTKGNMWYFDVTPLNVIDNYAQMVRGASQGDWAAVRATNPLLGWENTPMFAIMGAQIAGKNLRTHRDYRGLNDRFNDIIQQAVPSMVPGIGYEAGKITPQSLGGSLDETNLKTGRTNEISSFASKFFTGADYTSVNPGIVLSNAKKQLDNEVRLEKQYLNDVLRSSAPQDVKDRAIRNANEAVKVHLMTFWNLTNASI